MPRTEAETTTELVERLGRWVEQQPEYPFLFLADRQRRRRAARIVAYRLMVLPSVPAESPGRANYRKQAHAIGKQVSKFKVQMSAKAAKQRAKAERDRRRNARLSQRRLMEVAERAYEGESYTYSDDPAFD